MVDGTAGRGGGGGLFVWTEGEKPDSSRTKTDTTVSR